MSTNQRKSTKKEQTETTSPVQEIIEIPLPQPKKKGYSSKPEPVPVVIEDDSVSSIVETVEKPKPSKKGKESSKPEPEPVPIEVEDDSVSSIAEPVEKPKSSKKGKVSSKQEPVEEQIEEPKSSKKEKDSTVQEDSESEVIEKLKKQPKSLGEQMTDSVETLKKSIEILKKSIQLKDTQLKEIPHLISLRKKEFNKFNVDDFILQSFEKQKDLLKNEILELKSLVRDLSSVSKVDDKAIKQLESKRNKLDPSKPKKERAKIIVQVSTDSMNLFIAEYHTLKTNDGNQIFKQIPEKTADGYFLVERTQIMQLIHAYIREKSLRQTYPEDKGRILINDELKPLFSTYLEGDFDKRVDSKSILSVLSHHLGKL